LAQDRARWRHFASGRPTHSRCGETNGCVPRAMDSNADYIANLRQKLKAACEHAGNPEIAEAVAFRIGDGERAGGTPCKQRPEAAGTQQSPQPPQQLLQDPPQDQVPQQPVLRERSTDRPQAPPSPADDAAGRETLLDFLSSSESSEAILAAAKPAASRGVEEIANEVLRLRSLKRQHDEAREQLMKAEAALQRLPPHYLLQLHSFLERHLMDPSLAVHVQDAILKLIEALCAACRVELPSSSPESLMAGARRILRDPHSFTSKLCKLQPVRPSEAKSLAPCLLYASQYKRIREKEVDACCEALHSWVSAFYFYSNISDQIDPVSQELEEQELILARMDGGKVPPAPPMCTASSATTCSTGISSPMLGGAGRAARSRATCSKDLGGASEATNARRPANMQRRLSSSPVQAHRSTAPAGGLASSASGSLAGAPASAQRRVGAGSPKARSPMAKQSSVPGNSGITRRTSGPPQESMQTSSGRAASGVAAGVQRMQSHKALSQMLNAMKEGRAQSPNSAGPSSGASSLGSGCPPPFGPPQRSLRQPVGNLATVPERRASLPSTLLESVHQNRGAAATKDPRAPAVSRSVTAIPRF